MNPEQIRDMKALLCETLDEKLKSLDHKVNKKIEKISDEVKELKD